MALRSCVTGPATHPRLIVSSGAKSYQRPHSVIGTQQNTLYGSLPNWGAMGVGVRVDGIVCGSCLSSQFSAPRHDWAFDVGPSCFLPYTMRRLRSGTVSLLLVVPVFLFVLLAQTYSCANPADVVSHRTPELRLLRRLPAPGAISAVTWSWDGSRVAALSYGPQAQNSLLSVPSPFGSLIEIWSIDGQTHREIRRPKPFFEVGDTIAFVADSKQLVTPPVEEGDDLTSSVLDIDTGNVVREVEGSPAQGRRYNKGKNFVLSPDHSILAVSFGVAVSRPVVLYSTKDWSEIAAVPESEGSLANMAFSMNGELLAVSTNGNILIYNIASGRTVTRWQPFSDIHADPGSIAFSPSGDSIAVAARLVPAAIGRPDGSIVRIAPQGPVRIFRLDGSQVASYPGAFSRVEGMAWSCRGTCVVFIEQYRTLHLWDPMNPSAIGQLVNLDALASSLAVSPNGEHLAVGAGKNLEIYRLSE